MIDISRETSTRDSSAAPRTRPVEIKIETDRQGKPVVLTRPLRQLEAGLRRFTDRPANVCVLTGPRRCGKTFLLDRLQRSADRAHRTCRYLTAAEINAGAADTISTTPPRSSAANDAAPALLLIDDAQRIHDARLVALIERLSTPAAARYSAVLCGLPELLERCQTLTPASFAGGGWRHLSIPALTGAEAQQLIRQRLDSTGSEFRRRFPPATRKSIERYGRGNIGHLLALCERLRDAAAGDAEGYVMTAQVDKIAAQLGLRKRRLQAQRSAGAPQRPAAAPPAALELSWADWQHADTGHPLTTETPDQDAARIATAPADGAPRVVTPPPNVAAAPRRTSALTVGFVLGMGAVSSVVLVSGWQRNDATLTPPETALQTAATSATPATVAVTAATDANAVTDAAIPIKPDRGSEPALANASAAAPPLKTRPPAETLIAVGADAGPTVATPTATLALATIDAEPAAAAAIKPQTADAVADPIARIELALAEAEPALTVLSQVARLRLQRDLRNRVAVAAALRDAFGLRHRQARRRAEAILCASLSELCKD